VIDALLRGAYEGNMTLEELKKYGNLGIGTIDCLDGELILIDGNFYNIKSDGKVYIPDEKTGTPFASVVDFRADRKFQIKKGTDFPAFRKLVSSGIKSSNLFYAFRLEGVFRRVKTRSVPRQSKPYGSLIEVVKKQPVFEFRNVSGVMAGFYCPPYVKGVNVPGYHLHFLTGDKRAGGHVLDFEVDKAQLEICEIFNFRMFLSSEKDFLSADLTEDREKELKKVESGK
jgi:acetolactate decarboxylase